MENFMPRLGQSKYNNVKIGDVFGKWIILDTDLDKTTNNWTVLCRCECGLEKRVIIQRLYSGKTRGCQRCVASGKNHYKWNGVGDMPRTSIYTIKNNCKNKNRRFNLSIEYLWELYQKQNGKCALTGESIYFLNGNTKAGKDVTASLDRIDSSIGYEIGNVQWVHKHINKIKQDLPQDLFIKLCKQVAKHNG